MDPRRKQQSGFSMIELLVALAISALIVTQIGAMWMGIGQVMRVVDSRKDATLEGGLIGLEKIGREIQSSPIYPDIPFEGTDSSVSFPKLVSLSGQDPLNAKFRLGQVQTQKIGQNFDFKKVEYSYDSTTKSLTRKEDSEESKIIAEHLEEVVFSYAIGSSSDGKTWTWAWSDRTPMSGPGHKLGAVRVHLKFDSSSGQYTIPGVERTFLVARVHPMSLESEDGSV